MRWGSDFPLSRLWEITAGAEGCLWGGWARVEKGKHAFRSFFSFSNTLPRNLSRLSFFLSPQFQERMTEMILPCERKWLKAIFLTEEFSGIPTTEISTSSTMGLGQGAKSNVCSVQRGNIMGWVWQTEEPWSCLKGPTLLNLCLLPKLFI